jgi:uncharacterized UBP type Zn finger protein
MSLLIVMYRLVTYTFNQTLIDIDLQLNIYTNWVDNSIALNSHLIAYALAGFVVHISENDSESGHYITFMKGQLDDQWIELDDAVSPKYYNNWAVLLSMKGDVIAKGVYILLYNRK